jgi:cell pole-organizing protein PopZ
MEEILASIRKIISEDSTETPPAQPAAAPPRPAPQAVAEPEPDVLELTQIVEEEPVPPPAPPPVVAPPPVMAAAPEPIRPADDIVFQTIDEEPEKHDAPPVSQGLVSDKARNAVDDALSGLDFDTEEPTPSAAPVAPIDGRSVEAVFDRAVRETFDPVLRTWLHEQADVIVERMKPAIREWMEDNLPAMLKSAVEAEVARAVRARSKR